MRSPFWLTERLGRTSHPTLSVGRGEMETVKHPSPSTYPEMYDGRSVAPRASREPASCAGLRFATPVPYGTGVTVTDASPRRDQSLRGHSSEEPEDFPRHYPPSLASSLIEAAGVGFAVMSGCTHEVTSVQGNSLTRQGISLP